MKSWIYPAIILIASMVEINNALVHSSNDAGSAQGPQESSRRKLLHSRYQHQLLLVPSQVPLTELPKRPEKLRANTLYGTNSSSLESSPPESNRSSHGTSKVDSSTAVRQRPAYTNQRRNKKKGRSRRLRTLHGNLPDIYWRSIPMDHLRAHPLFEALPERVHELGSKEQVRDFRQDSWQWDALHNGRCTTSQTSAALGFLEPKAGEFLRVPYSWRRGGEGAFYRLGSPAITTLDQMREELLEAEGDMNYETDTDSTFLNRQQYDDQLWTPSRSDRFPFAARYLAVMTEEEREQRKDYFRSRKELTGSQVKMSWGNAQESTALLTALNYFDRNENLVCVKEVGMCGAGLDLPLLLGASPDALLCHDDGSVEVLEVKNHCPFQPARKNQRRKEKFVARQFGFPDSETSTVPLHYVPQLMMEMLCVGPECTSAVMVRQTATEGALIIRLVRNDEWLHEMIFWLQRFAHDFVEKNIPPHTNFFWEEERYQSFLEETERLGNSATVLDHVPHNEIQRKLGEGPNTNSLFLD